MSFTFLGYFHFPPISITIAYLPVIIAACVFGPRQAVLTGIVFGLGSLYKASASYISIWQIFCRSKRLQAA